MKLLVLAYFASVRFVQRVISFPRAIWTALSRLWRSGPLKAAEAERIDRICNPSKYLGKP